MMQVNYLAQLPMSSSEAVRWATCCVSEAGLNVFRSFDLQSTRALDDMNNHAPSQGCHVDVIEKTVDPNAVKRAQSAFLSITGMGCPTCAKRVYNGLLQLDGVIAVDVSLQSSLARVLYDPMQVTPEALPAAVAAAGNDGRHHYAARVLRTYARID